MAAKRAFGGKQAAPFGKGAKEQENAKPRSADKGRERQETSDKKKTVPKSKRQS